MWQAKLSREPPLADRIGFYLCQIASILVNVNKGKGGQSVKASELDPWHDPWKATSGKDLDTFASSLKADPSPE